MSFRNMCLQYAEHGLTKQLWTEFTYPPVIAAYGIGALASCAVFKVACSEPLNGRNFILTAITGVGISLVAFNYSFESLYG